MTQPASTSFSFSWQVVGDEFRIYEWDRRLTARLIQQLRRVGDESFGMSSFRQYGVLKITHISESEFGCLLPRFPMEKPRRYLRVE